MSIERAIYKGTISGLVQIRNMYTCEVTPAGSDTSSVLWQAYLASIYTEALQILSGAVSFYSIELQTQVGQQWSTFDEVAVNDQGQGSGDALPNAVAWVLIAKATGVGHMGRKFFGCIPESITTANALTAGALGIAADALLAYITPFVGLSGGLITPGVVTAAGAFHPFIGGTVSSLLGSMRRRKPGNGI